jgi:predicted NBD/HSP70 family sugar kinase
MPHIHGDQSVLKHINRLALVALVKAQPGVSRTDLAKQSALTKVTVGLLIQELIDEGWLREETPSVGQGVGRRPVPISLDPLRIGLLGAELGVDYVAVAACNLLGEVLYSRRIPFRHSDVNRSVHALAALVGQAHRLLVSQRRRPLGLAVGVPGMLDADNRILRFAPNLHWREVPFQRLLAARMKDIGCGGLPVSILNEARAAALSEYVFGEAPHAKPLVYLSMGIGLGAGVVLSDQLYVGNDGLAGEVGHTILERDGPECACGRRGCAETFISQRAVSRQATGREQPILSIGALIDRIARGDRATIKAARRAGEYLGLLMQNLSNTINPAVFVLGGPLCQLGHVFVDPALAQMKANAGSHPLHRHSVRLCRFGLNACAVGSAASVFQNVFSSLAPQEWSAPILPISTRGSQREPTKVPRSPQNDDHEEGPISENKFRSARTSMSTPQGGDPRRRSADG